MIIKRVIILCILVFSITFIFQVKSYTLAKVENSANISITSSDNALIAIPEIIKLQVDKHITENITNQLTASGAQEVEYNVQTQYELVNGEFEIINNMSEEVFIEVNLNEDINGISLINNSGRLSSGGLMKINVSMDNTIQDIPRGFDITINADWKGGSATINSQVNLKENILEPVRNITTIEVTPVLNNVMPCETEKNEDESITEVISVNDNEVRNVEETNVNSESNSIYIEPLEN